MPVDDHLYPVNLILTGRRCVVVGGGSVAARKVRGLLAAGAAVHVVAPAISQEIRELPLTFDERPYETRDLEGAWLVVAATGIPEVNASVRADADAAHVWLNAADDPSSCSVTLPAVTRQGPVMVTVSTSGRSPALASWVKGQIETMLGPEFATLATLLGEARAELQAAGRSTEEVDWRPAFESDILDAIRAGDFARARKRLEACLLSS
ncbi:MAG: bifunctional precorrin-2 dehydrogenase/sirohydrochlorin ferrochelatase [Acidimicrobiaceae bacterium]|nr:bifunctional precorrin-2 dehydrogenase/sirohydrochlorin ferrochelatase [Acidimicrobiaceae bacterium]